jgi:hypothetical protein
VPSAPETQWRQRTALAHQRASLAFVLIGALMATHTHAWLGVSAGLLVIAAGLRAQTPRELAAVTAFAAASATVLVLA